MAVMLAVWYLLRLLFQLNLCTTPVVIIVVLLCLILTHKMPHVHNARGHLLQVDDPQQLLPKLPKPKDLQPFPNQLTLQFLGHDAKVRHFSWDCSHALP